MTATPEDNRPEESAAAEQEDEAVVGGAAADSSLDELIEDSDERGRIGSIVGERYRITELLGTGGMGAVYKAEHIHMRKQVALKVLHREMTILPEVVERFEREAIAAGRIDHPNVVQARDFGRLEDGAYYLVLDYVDGESLSYVLENEQFTIGRSLNIAMQIAEALAAAHDEKIVHRDLKPDNVMLVRHASGFERVRVLDFGIAKVNVHERSRSARPLTKMGSVFGTPEYMSPEQAAGQRVDHRADVYSLGLLLYRMITGSVPFTSDELNAILMMQITQAAPDLDARVPREVRDLVSQLLEKLPDARPQSANEVVERIARILDSSDRESLSHSVAPDPTEADHTSGNDSLSPPPFSTKLDQSFLGAPITVAGNPIPLWRLGVVSLILVGLASTLIWLLRSPEPGKQPVAVPTATAPIPTTVATNTDPELERLLALAFSGDDQALAQLEARSPKKRSVREWLALGRGRSKLGHQLEAMQAYREALARDRSVASDPALRKDVWLATREGDGVEIAIQLAADYLGSEGADLLYQVWVETKDVTPVTQQARRLLQKESVRASASPALLFLLEWREAMSCDDYRKLLPRAAVAADTRARTLLQRAQTKNDCELPEEALAAALSALKDRPTPTPY